MCERVFIFMNTLEYKPLCTIHGMNTSPSVLFMSMNTSRRTLEYCIQSIHHEPWAQWKLVPCTARRGAAVHGPTRLGGGQVLVSQEARQGGQKRGPTALHEKKRR